MTSWDSEKNAGKHGYETIETSQWKELQPCTICGVCKNDTTASIVMKLYKLRSERSFSRALFLEFVKKDAACGNEIVLGQFL